MRTIAILLGFALALSASAVAVNAEEEGAKHTIKACMKDCFKGPLIKKVTAGEASDDEKAKLHEMMVS
ncbi:MAG: hypothetical protein R3C05_29460, partial [Pirellulaceae bacterium]